MQAPRNLSKPSRPLPHLGIACVMMVIFSLLISSCQSFVPAATTLQPRPTSEAATIPAVTGTPTLAAAESSLVTLDIWLPPSLAESGRADGGYLHNVNAAVTQQNPNLMLNLLPKALYGLGGISNLLLTTQAANPAKLPDIVVVDAAELAALTSAGISQPVDSLFPQGYWEQFYPVMVEAVASPEGHVGVPLVTDLVFMVYDKTIVTSPPSNWSSLAEVKTGYVFPAASGDGSSADTFILQYLALGGKLVDADGHPTADTTIISQILRTYQAFLELGVFPPEIRELATYGECWDLYLVNETGMTDARYSLYESYRQRLKRSSYAPIPMISGEPSSLAHSYVWVIVTENPARQALAAQYIEFAMQPEAVAIWANDSKLLPAEKAALPLVIEDSSFRDFLESLLYSAYPYPNLSVYARIQSLISQAIEDVLAGIETPERAATSLAKAITSLR
ncbi:MAG: extracellular solute-binding protein [Anaerolineae bacterium]